MTSSRRTSANAVEQVDRLRSTGLSVDDACARSGIARRSYYRLRQSPSPALETPASLGAAGTSVEPVPSRIMDAALARFGAYGFKGTTLRGVAAASGVSHGLIRYHFKTKSQLWIGALTRIIRDFQLHVEASVSQLPPGASTPAAQLAIVVEQFVRFTATRPEVVRMLTMEPPEGSPHLRKVVDSAIRSHFALVTRLISEGQAAGTVRMGDPAMMYYFLATTSQVFTIPFEIRMLTRRDIFSEADVHRVITVLFDFLFVT